MSKHVWKRTAMMRSSYQRCDKTGLYVSRCRQAFKRWSVWYQTQIMWAYNSSMKWFNWFQLMQLWSLLWKADVSNHLYILTFHWLDSCCDRKRFGQQSLTHTLHYKSQWKKKNLIFINILTYQVFSLSFNWLFSRNYLNSSCCYRNRLQLNEQVKPIDSLSGLQP